MAGLIVNRCSVLSPATLGLRLSLTGQVSIINFTLSFTKYVGKQVNIVQHV